MANIISKTGILGVGIWDLDDYFDDGKYLY